MKNVHKNLTTLLLCCSLGAFADESQYFHTSQFFPASVQSPTASDLGSVEQANHYYPTGVLLAKSTNPGLQRYKYNGKEFEPLHGLNWNDYGARWYDPAINLFTTIDPLCEKYYHINPYVYCGGNPVNRVDPDGREWFQSPKGSIAWTNHKSQKEMDQNGIQGRFLGVAVAVFQGSLDEKLGKGDNLFGEGSVLAKATVYGPENENDIMQYDAFTMSSDFKQFGAIADGEYTVNEKKPGKGGPLSSHWAVNNAGPVDCLNGENPSPLSPYSSTQKNGIYIHNSNKNGYAGKTYNEDGSLKSAISTGCLLIVPSKQDKLGNPINNGWEQFNNQLHGIKKFKLILQRK